MSRSVLDVDSVVSSLTLLEKAALLSGENVWESRSVRRLGVPSMFFADGPHGLRRQSGPSDHLGLHESEKSTCFPTAATLANSWDPQLTQRVGAAIGAEAAQQGVQVLLGPGLNIKRSPVGGRNFEYYSEDPLLSGVLAAGFVRGVQSQGVAATPKHFAANSQELLRMANDSVVDERTLREMYLTGFEIVVRQAAPWALMSSYNKVNGVYANENSALLSDILRGEWGFDGAVITDWGGGNDAVAAVEAGSALEMPSPGLDSARQIVSAVDRGVLAMADVDARVRELLTLAARTSTPTRGRVDVDAHHQLAREAAASSMVLLRNEGGVLPLAGQARVAVVGDFARAPRYQGAGSSQVNPYRVVDAAHAVEKTPVQCVSMTQGFRRDGVADAALLRESVEAASRADVVVMFVGLPELYESEGIDRADLSLPANQVEAIEAVAGVNDNVVVVLAAGGVVEMPWRDRVKAIVHGYLNGQAGGQAVWDVLTGVVNPGGRLAETFVESLSDHPTADIFPADGPTAQYREGLFVGYRYFSTVDAPVAFPFGFGLSYTSFAYEDFSVEGDSVVVTVLNTGVVPGHEVVQVYVSGPQVSAFVRPARVLAGFSRVFVEPGESVRVRVVLADEALRSFDVVRGSWVRENGVYRVQVGSHVNDVRAEGSFEVSDGVVVERPVDADALGVYWTGEVRSVSDAAFAALLGRDVPSSQWQPGPLDVNDPISRWSQARSPLARCAAWVLRSLIRRSEKKGKPDLNLLFLSNMPVRAIGKMTNGAMSMEMVHALLLVVNGHHIRGIGRLVSAWWRNMSLNRATRRELAGGS